MRFCKNKNIHAKCAKFFAKRAKTIISYEYSLCTLRISWRSLGEINP